MGGLDLSAIGIVLAGLTGIGSYFLGRYLRQRRVAKRQAQLQAVAQAAQSRQVRRARERGARK
ncbi:hypothetical protein [Variovorax ginsengisoli]|uniref:Uncharacterized protein n=1 Tax=Variovorax ginsengisoli TaxID=363844 RepID=A0ABT9SBF3_9BURK|nr:hypothetical protein [Variovorax ginsengisoli]MDP9901535.1 hypothetical protein [Variovorax ginsengisoli]